MLVLLAALAWSAEPDPAGPDIEVSATEVDFGEARSAKKKSIVVRNVGVGAPLRVTEILVPDPHFTVDLSGVPFDLEPGAKRTLDITYIPGAEPVSSTTIGIFSTDPDEVEVKVSLIGTAFVEGNRTRAQLAADLQPFDWSLSSWFVAAEVEPSIRVGWGPSLTPRLALGLILPLAGSRIQPVATAAWVGTSTTRTGSDDRIGRYDYLAWQRGFEASLGVRVRVFPVSEPMSPEVGLEPTLQILQAGMEGAAGGATVGPLYEAQRLFGARLSGGVVGLLHDRGLLSAHIGVSLVPVRGELTGNTVTTTAFATLGYRRVVMFRR